MLETDHPGVSGSVGRPRSVPSTTTARAAAAGPTPALARCIGVSAAEFADRYWSSAALLTPAAELDRDFGDLLSTEAVDELISARGLRTPFLRMAKDGSVLASASFTRSGGVGAGIADQVADDKVLGQLAAGATLVLQALHRSWPPLIVFGSRLAAELGHPVQINAYITPPASQGFAAHYDTHDVFVLQVAGAKRWTIHAPVIDDPLPDQTWDHRRTEVAARAGEPALIDTVLTPGDALYLPRGFLHSAVAQDEVSIHLTVGVHPITGYDLARELIAAAATDRDLRRSLPMRTDVTDLAVMTDHVRAAAHRLATAVDQAGPDQLATVARRVGRRQSGQTRPMPLAPLAQLTALRELDAGTPLTLRPGLRPTLRRSGDRWALEVIDATVHWPAQAHGALLVAMSGAVFCPGELPDLDPEERLVVAGRLLREGVVVPAAAGGPDRGRGE
ncbi:MAG TPA: cupin domain-containing protein [Nakamurella sp.]